MGLMEKRKWKHNRNYSQQSTQGKKRCKSLKTKNRAIVACGTVSWYRTICINIVPEKQERKEKKLEEIIAKNFPNFMENSKPRTSVNPEQKPLGTLKINNKENTLKAVREAIPHTEKQ